LPSDTLFEARKSITAAVPCSPEPILHLYIVSNETPVNTTTIQSHIFEDWDHSLLCVSCLHGLLQTNDLLSLLLTLLN
jgi:hypothetical protein